MEKTKREVNGHQRQTPWVGGPMVSKGSSGFRSTLKCNRCGREGHYERDCRLGRRAGSQPQNAGRFQPRGRGGDGRAQAAGRVYAMMGAKAASSGNLITSSCLFYGFPCCVLFDSGATYSFISKACVEKWGLSESELQFDLVVSTPASGVVWTSTMCVRCPIEVEGRQFKVNLICLPLQGLEVILGMDWVAANHILMDCGKKKLVFTSEEEKMSLTVGLLRQDIIKGASCFLVLSHLEVGQDKQNLDRLV
ncbi:uncharacterized protein LOC108344384 [Vigna angularis]|uniref:uncharacterized protein LOC108344384 n=1 Tax=Phaseolus angularis TaxID=3914 RepID=UPI00080A0BFC|nr:uncharacterized protein LOC108344384 [Vigna angularis]